MTDEAELLRRYALDADEVAFAELVRCRVDSVYSAALRQMNGDANRAREVTQDVFLTLARKARQLAGHSNLGGWLFTTTRLTAKTALRTQRRRQIRELEIQKVNPIEPAATDWSSIGPVLDDALHELPTRDRDALLLRYFEDRPLAAIGARLGLSENSARMRVDRALDKLRVRLAQRGITSTTSALASLLVVQSVSAAPVGIASQVSAYAIAGAGAPAGAGLGILELMKFVTKQKIALVVAASLVGFGAYLFLERITEAEIAADALKLDQQLADLRRKTSTLRLTQKPIPEPAPITPAVVPIPADPVRQLRALNEFVSSGLADRLSWGGGSVDSFVAPFGKLFGLTAAETAALRSTADDTRSRISAMALQNAIVGRNGGGFQIAIPDSAETRAVYDSMLSTFAATLGPQRLEFFESLGFRNSLESVFKTAGLGAQKFSVVSRPSLSQLLVISEGLGSTTVSNANTLDDLKVLLGPFQSLLPEDFPGAP